MKELHELIINDLRDRQKWEDRQAIWYQMRHDGLRRKVKPWPGAADLHFPLADSMIEKLKPFYVQVALYSSETIASFISLFQQDFALTNGVAQWFDHKLKQKSNLEAELLTAIDHMLMAGRSAVKIYWDVDRKRLAFDAKDPVYLIVPWNSRDLCSADRIVEVKHYSVEAYKRLTAYNQDPELIRRITGRASTYGANSRAAKWDEKYRREGITFGQNDEQIVVWEVFERCMDHWNIHWWSPLLCDEPLRQSQVHTYKHGEVPFVEFCTEIKDKGYYSPRGVPEIVAPFEASLCKIWNEKHDAMTLLNRPFYSADGHVVNAGNIKMIPGSIMPFRIEAVQQAQPAISWDQEMIQMRSVAEYRVGMPDFGLGKNDGTNPRTATEVDRLSALMGQNVDLRARIFRQSFGKLLNQAWSLCQEFDRENLNFWVGNELKQVDPAAIQGVYEVKPNGSADNASRQFVMQKAIARFQMFQGNPFINQGPLVKSVLQSDDPRLVRDLYVEPADKNYDQAEEQADEINNMMISFPVQVSATDDHQVHLETLVQFIERRMTMKELLSAEVCGLLMQHGGQHYQALSQDRNAKQFMLQIKPQMDRAIGFLQGIVHAQAQPVSSARIPTASSVPGVAHQEQAVAA